MLIRDIDPNLISENAASQVFGPGAKAASKPAAIEVGTVAGATAVGGGIVAHNLASPATEYDEKWYAQEIIPGIPYTFRDVGLDMGFIAAGVIVGAFGGPPGEAAAAAANATKIMRVVKILRALWSKVNPIETIAKAGVPWAEFFKKICHAMRTSATWSVATNTLFNLLADLGINVNLRDAWDRVVNEDGEQQPTQDQIRDPAFCAAHGIEPTIDPALEKDPEFIDVYIGARHFHKSIVKYNGKIYPVYLEADYDGPGAPSGFTVSESVDLARIKLLTHKLLNG